MLGKRYLIGYQNSYKMEKHDWLMYDHGGFDYVIFFFCIIIITVVVCRIKVLFLVNPHPGGYDVR